MTHFILLCVQQSYSLRGSGQLDAVTLQMLQLPRCGNPDAAALEKGDVVPLSSEYSILWRKMFAGTAQQVPNRQRNDKLRRLKYINGASNTQRYLTGDTDQDTREIYTTTTSGNTNKISNTFQLGPGDSDIWRGTNTAQTHRDTGLSATSAGDDDNNVACDQHATLRGTGVTDVRTDRKHISGIQTASAVGRDTAAHDHKSRRNIEVQVNNSQTEQNRFDSPTFNNSYKIKFLKLGHDVNFIASRFTMKDYNNSNHGDQNTSLLPTQKVNHTVSMDEYGQTSEIVRNNNIHIRLKKMVTSDNNIRQFSHKLEKYKKIKNKKKIILKNKYPTNDHKYFFNQSEGSSEYHVNNIEVNRREELLAPAEDSKDLLDYSIPVSVPRRPAREATVASVGVTLAEGGRPHVERRLHDTKMLHETRILPMERRLPDRGRLPVGQRLPVGGSQEVLEYQLPAEVGVLIIVHCLDVNKILTLYYLFNHILEYP